MKVEHDEGARFKATCRGHAVIIDQPEENAGSDAGLAPPELMASLMQTGCAAGPPFHCDLLAMRGLFVDSRWQWPGHEPIFVPHRNGRFELGYCLRQRMEKP
jgi:hypothetical protein